VQYDDITGATAGGTNHFNPGRDKYDRVQADIDTAWRAGKCSAISKHIKEDKGLMRNMLDGVCAANIGSLVLWRQQTFHAQEWGNVQRIRTISEFLSLFFDRYQSPGQKGHYMKTMRIAWR
jgi:hypothetical protein